MYLLTRLADVNAEFEEFTVDVRSAPKRVLAAHLPKQFTDFLRHRRAGAGGARHFSKPKHKKNLSGPTEDRFSFAYAKKGMKLGPGPLKTTPQQPVAQTS